MFGATCGPTLAPLDALPATLETLLPSPTPANLMDVSAVSEDDDCDNAGTPFELTCVRHGLSEDIGRCRDQMEDAAVVLDDLAAEVKATTGTGAGSSSWPKLTALYAVFDGHGGKHASGFAAERIVRCLTASEHFPSDMGAALRDAILSIEAEYWDFHLSKQPLVRHPLSRCESAGTTALVAVVWGDTLYIANTGDCRAVLSQQGKVLVLTRDHRPTDPEEQKRITAAGGYVNYEQRVGGVYNVSRVIGDFESYSENQYQYGHLLKGDPTAGRSWPLTAEPEITQHKLGHQDEFMIMACDGFWDFQGCKASQRPVDLVRSWLQEHNSPQQAAEQLMKEVLPKTQDNVTIVVVCFGKDPPAEAGPVSG